jgi:hypothetical protein
MRLAFTLEHAVAHRDEVARTKARSLRRRHTRRRFLRRERPRH